MVNLVKLVSFPKLELFDYKFVEANGLSGGIWLLWDNGKINIEIMDTNSLSIAANHIIDLG